MRILADQKSDGRARRILRIVSVAAAGLLVCGITVRPVTAATKVRDEDHKVSYRAVDRAEIENLQRWVAAGHEEWSKDPRLVAANELTRIAADFGGNAMELAPNEPDAATGATKRTFTWAPLDGRAVYRITVERFEWLLTIANDLDEIVWVPTIVETQNRGARQAGKDQEGSATGKATSAVMRLSRS